MTRALDLNSLAAAYATGTDPADVVHEVYDAIAAAGERPAWISLLPREGALAAVESAKRRRAVGEDLPLFGVPFAVKDNIDVAGLATTAACPDFAYTPERSALVVEKLVAAGAIVIGKTNLDQFATGLNGTRSPYGAPSSVFDERYISGGSSSGSAVAVAAGQVSFSLGTDTAGSGRVPAAFNNIVGLKPTKGLFSTSGLVPACRSLDCISVFAASVGDALSVSRIMAGFDAADAYSRRAPSDALAASRWPETFRFGVPSTLDFFGDDAYRALFEEAASRLEGLGGQRVAFDFTPFASTAALLYAGPWVAERLAAIKTFAETSPEAIHPVVRAIVLGGRNYSAVDAFEGQYRLAALIREAERAWATFDVMLLPTAGTIYTIEDLLTDPVKLNSNLGAYTNFVNLMDLSGIAVPAGFRPDGLPFGVSLFGRAFEDGRIASLADRLHRTLAAPTVGSTGIPLLASDPAAETASPETITLAVVGAHLLGQPLNWQLTERGAKLVGSARTAKNYRLHALAGTEPPKPGLVFEPDAPGGIELELWELSPAAFGSFVAEIPPPLGIGTVALEDGSQVKGFLCESYALAGAEDITAFGGWRAFLSAR